MKKRGNHENKNTKKSDNAKNSTNDKKKVVTFSNEDRNEGFGEWLRSADGIEMMRLFVIANSILVFMTLAWPNMQEVITIVRDYFTVFVLGILTWYSTSVWKLIDNYFKDQFQSYLEEEYRKNPRMKTDVQKHSAGKATTAVTTPRPETTEAPMRKIAEVCELNVCPVEGAENNAKLEQLNEEKKVVAGGTSENEATKGSTDENAFLEITPESGLESRNSTDNKAHVEEPRPVSINHRIHEQGKKSVANNDQSSTSPVSETAKKKLIRYQRKTISPNEIPKKKQSTKKRKIKTIILTEKDFAAVKKHEVSDDDFWEFEEDAENREPQKGILVSELPFKPRADIGDLERVTADEYCPLTLEEESSCEETVKWP